jgi:hypothetical protein
MMASRMLSMPGVQKVRPFSVQTTRDHVRLCSRIKGLGRNFAEVRGRLQGRLKRDLMELAVQFIEKYELQEMDRLERRTFDGMVTWFCRNNVLTLLDFEDERRVRALEAEPQEHLGGDRREGDDATKELFAQVEEVGLEAGAMEDDLDTNNFSLGF